MICRPCQAKYKLNVVVERKSKTKALRTESCDVFVRWCPAPEDLLKLPNLTPEERDFLNSAAEMNWLTAKLASTLLQIEAKGKEVAA